MIEQAFISGQLGKAIFADGGRYFLLDTEGDDPSECTPMDFSNFFTFGSDVRRFAARDVSDLISLREELLSRSVAHHTLRMVISGLDKDLDRETRSMMIQQADAKLGDREVNRFVEARMLGRPLPEGTDISMALELARALDATIVGTLYQTMIDAAYAIKLVNETWNATALEYFSSPEEQVEATRELVDLEMFSGVAIRIREGDRKALIALVPIYSSTASLKGASKPISQVLSDFTNRLLEKVDAASAEKTVLDRILDREQDLKQKQVLHKRRSEFGNRHDSGRSRVSKADEVKPRILTVPFFGWTKSMASVRAELETENLGRKNTAIELVTYGIIGPARVYWNLNSAELYEEVARRNEGVLSNHGALIVDTGEHTGRAAKDKAIVREAGSEDYVFWGDVNKDFPQDKFNALKERMMAHATGRDLFVQDTFVGSDSKYRLPIRVINELAWHALFAHTMFISNSENFKQHQPEFTIINFPSFQADPERDGTRSPTFILIDFSQRLVLIGGTSYAGEIKKSVFTLMNYLLPFKGVMGMHCSANVGADGDVAVFFGLSGTGKTTLSADPERRLIGDDEHGWSDEGVFNFEGGCYAKVIRLSAEAEPDIYRTTKMFGTILHNVIYDPTTRVIDLDDARKTENTRASFPLTSIDNIVPEGRAGNPRNIIMLTADAFGVLPPVSRLSPEQAMYHFLSGYTAKAAGTERGIKELQATFSTCFGAPFLPLHPGVYADLLGKKMWQHNAAGWLVNTGWSGGPYGIGQRIKIAYTRAMIRAILNGEFASIETTSDPIFGVSIPVSCTGVPSEILQPRNTWADKEAYDRQAADLVRRFKENFKKYEAGVSDGVLAAAPKI